MNPKKDTPHHIRENQINIAYYIYKASFTLLGIRIDSETFRRDDVAYSFVLTDNNTKLDVAASVVVVTAEQFSFTGSARLIFPPPPPLTMVKLRPH